MAKQHQKQLQRYEKASRINMLVPIIFFILFFILFAKNVKSQPSIVTTVVNTYGVPSYGGDGGLANNAYINITNGGNTGDIVTDVNGDIVFADYANNRIRKINHTTNIITTIAGTGTGTFGGDGGLATQAQIYHPIGIIVDALNNIYFSDASNFRIRRIDAITGIITTIAGTGAFSSGGNDGDNGLAINCQFRWASHLAIDGFSNLYVVDNYRVRRINLATGIILPFAGQTTTGYDPLGGDGMLASDIHFGGVIYGLLSDNVGNIYITDYHRIRKISGGIATTIIGHWWDNGQVFGGDGGLATLAHFNYLGNMCFDGNGNILICDFQNNLIRKYNPTTGIITTIAGDIHGGYPFLWGGFSGDGGYPLNARFNYPMSITYNNITGGVFIVDANNNRIRRIQNTCTSIVRTSNITICSSTLPYHWAGQVLTSSGSYTIHSTMPNGCDSSATLNLTVLGTMPPITGVNKVCIGSSIQLSNTFVGGNWESVAGRATINGSGLVTGISPGIATIRYSYNNELGCYAARTFNVTVNSFPSVPSISFATGTPSPYGAGGICRNRTFTLVGNPSGGTWSSMGGLTVNSFGLVNTGTTLGAASVTYTFTNSLGCSNSRTISSIIVACSPKGINTISKNKSITIYPNPSHSVINVKAHLLFDYGRIIITDLYGKQVIQQNLGLGNNSIDVSCLAKGMYLLTILTSEGKQTEKIIIE